MEQIFYAQRGGAVKVDNATESRRALTPIPQEIYLDKTSVYTICFLGPMAAIRNQYLMPNGRLFRIALERVPTCISQTLSCVNGSLVY